ncbi:MAG: GNAT family N-acetyltransferase [Alphaproteobacteria bacterium]|nr:GNAT family N-acetyltransferase [Alphaproteobacteria bacterium]
MTLDIRPLTEEDLSAADRIFRLAFGTFLGLPDPMAFMGDADLVRPRWRAAPEATLGAYDATGLVGSNFVTRWGSFGFFGPLTVRPDLWDRGIARALLGETMALFERLGTRQMALFTFPQSAKHVGLYQSFGFWPQALTPVMAKAVAPAEPPPPDMALLSRLAADERARAHEEIGRLTNAVMPGLDLAGEIAAAAAQGLGDTVLVREGGALAAMAVCHVGAGSEAGSGAAYVKFGAARPGKDAARAFERLLAACEAFARERGAERLVAGVNSARREAYRALLARGYRTVLQGVAMQRPDAPGTTRADCYVLDDWR